MFNLGQQSFIACTLGMKIRKYIFHYRENVSFTVLVPTAFWQHGENALHIKKIMIMIKTHFQLEKDTFGFPTASLPANGRRWDRRNMRFSNSAGKCSGGVRASSARGMCNNIPLAGFRRNARVST